MAIWDGYQPTPEYDWSAPPKIDGADAVSAFTAPPQPVVQAQPQPQAPPSPLGQPYMDAVKKFEGYNPKPYWDYRQWTSGYGTRAKHPGEVIDKDEADRRLTDEIAKARAIVDQHAPNAPEGVKAALTSLTYNAGPSWTTSGLGQAVKAGDYDTARTRFLQYNKAGGSVLPGLVSRRREEASWFDPNGAPAPIMALGGPDTPSTAPKGKARMAEDNGDGGFFSFLNKPISWGQAQPARDRVAASLGPDGQDGADFAKKYMAKYPKLAGMEGASEMSDVYNLQRELIASALGRRPATWGDALGEGLKGIGAVLTARSNPELGMKLAGTVGQNFRDDEDLRKKLTLQSAIQQAQMFGQNVDALVKKNAEERLRAKAASEAEAEIARAGRPAVATAPVATPLPTPQPPVQSVPGIAVSPTTPPQQPAAAPNAGGVQPPDPNAPPTYASTPGSPDNPVMSNLVASDESPEEKRLRAQGDAAAKVATARGDKMLMERAKTFYEQAKAIREERVARAKLPGDVEAYNYDMAQRKARGEINLPAFGQWQIEQSRAKSPQVNLTNEMRSENAESATIGKGAGERANKTMEAGEAAGKLMPRLSTLEALQNRVTTGKLANVRLSAAEWARELGVSQKTLESYGIGKNFAGDAQAFISQTSRQLVDMLGSGGFPSNNFSNADREFIEKTLPNLTNNPRGNRLMIAFARRAAQRDLEKAEAWAEAQEKGIRYDKFSLDWAKKVKEQDLSGDLRQEADAILGGKGALPRPKSKEEYDKLPKGASFLDPNGIERTKP